ncbi:hypothetical protein [Enterococcus mundtii]|uniref:hypothetical protein n=1 Tax=Enterococcus mundtii TaxID=53346 RepID=UPI000E00CF96|nr:hypothetical protein [Enterococcus mundtii]STE38135.1 Uncharacterised protein [Enterococcus mundtii]STE38153.1 Uncharacterised protein [Enterococcus mundtii]
MKRDVFERFINEQLTNGLSAKEIVSEISNSINTFGYLILNDEDGAEFKLDKTWLINFDYQRFILKKESERFNSGTK